jgi:hypothetical protein
MPTHVSANQQAVNTLVSDFYCEIPIDVSSNQQAVSTPIGIFKESQQLLCLPQIAAATSRTLMHIFDAYQSILPPCIVVPHF